MADPEPPPDDAELADLDVPALRRSLCDLGYAVARGLLTSDDLERLRRIADACSPDQSLRAQYNQSGDPKRYEYQLTAAAAATTTTTPRDGDDGDDDDGGGGTRLSRLASALCPDLAPSDSFCIVSEPGSADQPPHTDSIPPREDEISAEEWRFERTYLGVLAPLSATTDATGKTAVVPRSHRVDAAAAADEEIRVALAAGDALLLDGRTTHRGLANTSNRSEKVGTTGMRDRVRRMCFFTFKRPGITDGNAAAYLSDGDDDESDGSDDGSDDGIDDGSAEEEEESEVGSERDDVRGEAPAAKKARTRGVEKVVGPNSYDSRGG
jgi:hypothetical protein